MNAIAPKQAIPRGDAEASLRIDLAAAYRLVAHFGWDDLVFTHISVRLPGPDHYFLINRYGMMFGEITASSLVKVDLQGRLVEGSDALVNPAGFTIHSAIHAGRPDAQCVIHLHTIAGTAISCLEDGLAPIHQTAMLLNASLAYHGFEGLAHNHDERPRLVADLGDNPAMILRNHGTLTVGRTIAEAFTTMYFLERACAIQIAAQGSGRIRMPAAPVQDLVRDQAAQGLGSVANRLVWPALIRLLDREQPDFRN